MNHLIWWIVPVLLVVCGCAGERSTRRDPLDSSPMPRRPVATYSIVARDKATGQMGVAVQSHWFSVGSVVPWAEAGVGAVATQSLVDVRYGPMGLALMKGGRSAPEALRALVSSDSGEAVRQVAMVDAQGRIATHTGSKAIAEANHVSGTSKDGSVYSCQANMMGPKGVPEAMSAAFEGASGPLAQRLLAALEAAQRTGGDIRGKQSAAILIVKGESSGRPWDDRVVELRIEDHADPIAELRRVLTLHEAYERMNAGDAAIEKGDTEGALREYGAALTLAPQSAEMAFWTGVSLVNAKKVDEAMPMFDRAFADPGGQGRELVRRLPASGLLPDDPAIIQKIVSRGLPQSGK